MNKTVNKLKSEIIEKYPHIENTMMLDKVILEMMKSYDVSDRNYMFMVMRIYYKI